MRTIQKSLIVLVSVILTTFYSCLPVNQNSSDTKTETYDQYGSTYNNSSNYGSYQVQVSNVLNPSPNATPMQVIQNVLKLHQLVEQGAFTKGCTEDQQKKFKASVTTNLMAVIERETARQKTISETRASIDVLEMKKKELELKIAVAQLEKQLAAEQGAAKCVIELPKNYEPGSQPQQNGPNQNVLPNPGQQGPHGHPTPANQGDFGTPPV